MKTSFNEYLKVKIALFKIILFLITFSTPPLKETNVSIGDNRSFIDSNTAQKLTDDDIHRLKESGVDGFNIIKSLIANSDTWDNKTGFAQEKWLKKKQKK